MDDTEKIEQIRRYLNWTEDELHIDAARIRNDIRLVLDEKNA